MLGARSVQEVLQGLPRQLADVSGRVRRRVFGVTGPGTALVQYLDRTAHTANAHSALTTTVFVGDTSPCPLVVLMRAMALSQATPDVFALDTCLQRLPKQTQPCAVLAVESRSKFWTVGTANKGEGKSPGVKPLVSEFKKLLC